MKAFLLSAVFMLFSGLPLPAQNPTFFSNNQVSGNPTVTYVQVGTPSGGTVTAFVPAFTTANVTAGNGLCTSLAIASSTNQVSGPITDSSSQTYTLFPGSQVSNSTWTLSVYCKFNTVGGVKPTVTINLTGSFYGSAQVFEVGNQIGSPVGNAQTNSCNSGCSTSITTSNMALTGGSMIFQWAHSQGTPSTTAGWTMIFQNTGSGFELDYKSNPASPVAGNVTTTGSSDWEISMIEIK